MTDLMQLPIDAGYDTFGDPATYQVVDADPIPCTIIVDHNLQQWGETVSVSDFSVAVNVRRSEVSNRPRRGSTFVVEGATYTVEQALQQTRYEYTLLAVEENDD